MQNPQRFQQRFFTRLASGLPLVELFDYLPEVYLYVKNKRGEFVKVNRELANLRGCKSPDAMIGMTDFDLHPRHLAEQYVAEDRRVMQGKVPLPNQVWLVPDHQGELKWHVSTKIPLFDSVGRVIGIAGAMRDIERAEMMLAPYQEMEEVLTYVMNHYSEKIEVGELARLVHLSVSQFDRRFKQLFQMTPQQYILRVRINTACHRLTNGRQTIAEIAQQTGFYDQSYFTKQFRRQMKMTPLAYRKRYATGGKPHD